jgi:hypothetical protein
VWAVVVVAHAGRRGKAIWWWWWVPTPRIMFTNCSVDVLSKVVGCTVNGKLINYVPEDSIVECAEQ